MGSTYLMFASYETGSVELITEKEAEEAKELIQKNGGSFKEGYAMFGESDLLLVVDFPDDSAAVRTSVELSNHLGVSFSTIPALNFDELDKSVE